MKPTPSPTQKETYARTRDDPFFYGMRRGEAALARKGGIFDFQEKLLTKNIYRSASDIGDQGSTHFSDRVTEDVTYSPKVSPSDIVLKPVGRSLSGRWPKTYSPLAASRSDLNIYLHEADELPTVSCLNASETSEESVNQIGLTMSVQDASCCAVIAERYTQTSPEILSGRGLHKLHLKYYLSEDLLAGIHMDTGNLSSQQCTAKDKCMATLLIDGCNGLYQILNYKTYGSASADFMVGDILLKEYKKLTRSGKPDSSSSRLLALNIGMSSIGMSIAQLLSHDSTSTQEITHFQNLEKLGLLMVVSGYYNSQKKFKREILASAESVELLKNLLLFLDTNAAHKSTRFERGDESP